MLTRRKTHHAFAQISTARRLAPHERGLALSLQKGNHIQWHRCRMPNRLRCNLKRFATNSRCSTRARRTAPGVMAELLPFTRGVGSSTGYVARLRLSHVPVVALVWW